MPNFILFISLFFSSSVYGGLVPLKDNILFGFEKCKTLTADLQKGQLKESLNSSMDVHCLRQEKSPLTFKCLFFDAGSSKPRKEEVMTGGSELGEAVLKDTHGNTIKFLIGKKFASYHSFQELTLCAGIFIFEQDALKQKASYPKSDL